MCTRERHELGEPAGFFLQHCVRSRWRATWIWRSTVPCMIVTFERRPIECGAVRLQPLVGRDLVGTDHSPDLVVEDLGCGPGSVASPASFNRSR